MFGLLVWISYFKPMKFITLSLLLLFTSPLFADIVVIGNLQNSNPVMSARDVQEIYMGRKRGLADNAIAYPIDNSDLRQAFYKHLTDRPIAQINAYWARLKFSGHRTQPEILSDTADIINKVKANKNAIAYINDQQLKESEVRILFVIKDSDGKYKDASLTP